MGEYGPDSEIFNIKGKFVRMWTGARGSAVRMSHVSRDVTGSSGESITASAHLLHSTEEVMGHLK